MIEVQRLGVLQITAGDIERDLGAREPAKRQDAIEAAEGEFGVGERRQENEQPD